MPKTLSWITALVGAAAAASLAALAWQGHLDRAHPFPSGIHHAVALANGQVFFGRIEASGGRFTTLRDVFYIQTRQNPDSKDTANVLVKRGGEAHGPDRMVIHRDQVVLIEPVGPDSRIARLIAEQSRER